MRIFYHEELVDDFALFVDGDLFELQMRRIVRKHLSVAVILRVDGAPSGDLLNERFPSFLASSGAGYNVLKEEN